MSRHLIQITSYLFKTRAMLVALAFALCALSLPASAKQLDEATITQWINSVIPIQNWAKSHQEAFTKANKSKSPDMSTKGMVDSLRAAGLYKEAAIEMKKHGFKTPEDWAETQHQVIQAMMSLQMDAQPENAFNPKEQLAKITNNPNIPAEQKAKMVQIIETTAKMMEDAKKVNSADKAAVKPHMQEIMMKMSQAQAGAR